MDKNVYINTFAGNPGRDDYYVCAPMPGVAAFTCSLPIGTVPTATTLWTPLFHTGCFGANSLFGDASTGGPNRADNVDRFRYASLAAGVYTVSANMTTSGSVQVWKFPLTLTDETWTKLVGAVVVPGVGKVVNGLDSTTQVPRDNYSQALLHGVYTVATNNQPDFRFNDIMENIQRLPSADYTGSGMYGILNFPILGLGDTDSIVIKVSSPVGTTNSFILKVWSCIEYRPTAESIFDRFAGLSPDYDPVALATYRKAAQLMPLAVVAAENAHFWQMLLNILGAGAQMASFVPGPVGVIGTGASMLVAGLRELTVGSRR